MQYDSNATRDALEALINGTVLSKYRGQIAPKNLFDLRPDLRTLMLLARLSATTSGVS